MKENKMKTKRKRKERRLRILEKSARKRRARERAVASGAMRERRMAHRKNLAAKLGEAIREQRGLKSNEPAEKVSFLRRLLGIN